ncbi:TraR/DksA family transcriptional regulator [Micromonospora sp. NPDC051006]|uniref:TraR/DksA family transcriptional regulator n=1 Tax=Micromonospora sp. NPDC051006 TaxID=3364283 RepID=UPI00379E192E
MADTPDRADEAVVGAVGRLRAERAHTIEQIDHLTRVVAGIIAAASSENTDDEHDPEGQTIAFERAQASALLREARERLASIDRAVDRIDDDSYGRCERCGGPIASERLEALPATRTCIGCASSRR